MADGIGNAWHIPKNGDPSALLLSGDTPFAVIVLEVEGDQVTGIFAITNPDKLARVAVN